MQCEQVVVLNSSIVFQIEFLQNGKIFIHSIINHCNRCTDPGGSPCQYDEGSPLVQDFVDPDTSEIIPTAVGIFSKTNICGFGVIEATGIYTRLSEFSSWLLDTAGEQPVHPQGIQNIF